MKEVILIKIGEVVLKGLNKRSFEQQLINDIKNRIKNFGPYEVKFSQSTISIMPLSENSPIDNILPCVKKTLGIASFSRAFLCNKTLDDIKETLLEGLNSALSNAKTFKVESKRSDKKFYLTSPQISEEIGGFILEKFPNLMVDVHTPEVTVTIEIRDFGAYVRLDAEKGVGGLPVASSGKAAVLISGGIDSPVAAFMMAKRGIKLTAIHFASPPYTSPRAEKKVVELLEKVSEFSGNIKLFVVPFTKIQENIKKNCPEEFFTLIMRRMMMKISEKIALNEGCEALITGESLGQVASQTLPAISCTDSVVSMPVFRPLIGMDKEEIVAVAKKIETYDISIQPFEDCCTVFVPKHPKTKPKTEKVEEAENKENWDIFINDALQNLKRIDIQ